MNKPKKIVILGSTGSIGENALDIVERHEESFQVVGLAAGGNEERIREQIVRFRPQKVALYNGAAAENLRKNPPVKGVEILSGMAGVIEVALIAEAEMVLSAIVGAVGLLPTLSAIKAGKDIGLANKEVLVLAGELVMKEASRNKVSILPVDSEHSAIFQCLRGEKNKEVNKIVLTASGGPFRDYPIERLSKVTPEDALKHPNWSMGQKITIDSSTMMNKGLEVIEARWLFDIEPSRIQVLIHPQSIIHSLVEFRDSSVIAQLGLPDMRLPISYALHHPERVNSGLPPLDLIKAGPLSFDEPDYRRFPCLRYAFEAMEKGESYPAVLNAVNEVVVHAFIEKRATYLQIPEVVKAALDSHVPFPIHRVEEALRADHWGREKAKELLNR